MRDEDVRQLLRDLPRQRAGRDFTRGVLESLDAKRPQRRLIPALALAGTVVLVAGIGLWAGRLEQKRSDRQQIEVLKAEHHRLKHELEEIRATAPAPPLVYLGGERIDVYYDPVRSRHDGIVPAAVPVY